MRLEITVSKDIVKKKFDINDKYNIIRDRLNEHTVVLSNDLLKIWEQDAKDNNYYEQFQNWYFSIINSKKKFKKVKSVKQNKIKGVRNHEEKVLIATSLASKDKIVVGNIDIKTKKRNKAISFVSEGSFMKEKVQTVTMKDVRKVIMEKKTHNIFDIYETPTRLEIDLDSDAHVLSRYLTRFLRDAKNIVIQDRYILQQENERNLNEYVLRYLSKKQTKLTFVISENLQNDEVIKKFTNYKGFKSNIEFVDKKYIHHSLLETNEYIIDLGYRLRVFGDVDDGKTEQEIINITRK